MDGGHKRMDELREEPYTLDGLVLSLQSASSLYECQCNPIGKSGHMPNVEKCLPSVEIPLNLSF